MSAGASVLQAAARAYAEENGFSFTKNTVQTQQIEPRNIEADIYRNNYLRAAQALTTARGALVYAIMAIEHGSPSKHALQVLRKDLETIESLMA